MSTDREDPERGHPSGADPYAQTPDGLAPGEAELVAWAIGAISAPLLEDGLSEPDIRKIAREAYPDYERFQRNFEYPRIFLVSRILTKARRHMKLRGIQRRPGRIPHLLELFAMKGALDALTNDGRTIVYRIYFERRTLEQVAAELDLTVPYVEVAGRRAVRQAWNWWSNQRRES